MEMWLYWAIPLATKVASQDILLDTAALGQSCPALSPFATRFLNVATTTISSFSYI